MARDRLHNNVKEALLKEGWNITHDPLRIPIKNEVILWIES